MVSLGYIPTGGDANINPQRVILVTILMEGPKDNFGQVISNELFMRAYKTSRALPFPYVIIELCKLVKMLIISGLDNEV